MFRETVTKLLASRGKRKPAQPDTDDQSVAKLFEEVKAMMRELPEQIDENVRAASNNGKRRFRRFHPRMIEDVLMRPEMRESSSGFLIVISTLRDDFPWLYELGLDVHRALKSGNKQKFQEARAAFSEMLKFSARSKLTRMLADSEDEETFFILHHLPEVLDRFLYALEPRTKRLAIRKAPTATG